MPHMQAIRQLLDDLYPDQGLIAFEKVAAIMARFETRPRRRSHRLSQADAVLITYADMLRETGQSPLRTLHAFARDHLKGCFSAIHLLPFFPYSSDDGFSVIDFFSVDAAVGTWDDAIHCGADFHLMIDFVLNHVSAQSRWFTDYLAGRPGFAELAIEVDPAADLSAVTRPRALPLLTPFTKASGEQVFLWTTFSADQIDLNYKSIDVLGKMVEVLLFYVAQGARLIRMDAVAYLWKTPGTPCIHLPQTHAMVRLFRKILDQLAPEVLIVTETNVPHAENIGYFGNGYDEAQMVYNFTLPPLLLHAFVSGDTQVLSGWAQGLKTPSRETAFFNFTASHDGIGVRPLEGILPGREIDRLVEAARDGGGRVSGRRNADGMESPYELNITYVDALGLPGQRGTAAHAARFLASQAIALALPGVPAVYLHSLLGSRNWQEGVGHTGRPRTINREKLNATDVLAALGNPADFRSRVFFPYCRMLQVRRQQPAFHPKAGCEVLWLDRRVFAIKREGGGQTIHALTHIGGPRVALSLEPHCGKGAWRDLLTGRRLSGGTVTLHPHQTLWLSPVD
jgi:glucosylglycerate phosphorylase